jgi:endonuclease/exonuclease/phosphatase family metal-dependent hydrolase
MRVRVAVFNVENMFTRPSAFADDAGASGRQAVEDHAELNRIVEKAVYSEADKGRLLEIDAVYKFSAKNPPSNALVTLQKIRGQLFSVAQQSGLVSVPATGRSSWTGWFELRRTDIVWEAIRNTGLVIKSVDADIMMCVEAENRPTLDKFNSQVLGAELEFPYKHVMLVDGNDERGIDLGVLSDHNILDIRSHVDDVNGTGQRIFSRDSPEYMIELPNSNQLVVIPQHFKSKRGGNSQTDINRRKAQVLRAAEIAESALARTPFVIVAGDFNDTPSNVLAPFTARGFEDIQGKFSYPNERPGTFDTGTAANKIDYLLMSPQLRARLVDCGIERRGTFAPNTWDPFPSVTSKKVEASDHHALWADFDF